MIAKLIDKILGYICDEPADQKPPKNQDIKLCSVEVYTSPERRSEIHCPGEIAGQPCQFQYRGKDCPDNARKP